MSIQDYIQPLAFDMVTSLSVGVMLLPLISFIVLFFGAKFLPRKGDWLSVSLTGGAFILSVIIFYHTWGQEAHLSRFHWFNAGASVFTISILIDNISALMLLLVSLISFLVHIYSLEYMKGKKNYTRYFPYLDIFTFAMLGLVISDNLMVTFMFWELVGFSSYLLIGFWFTRKAAVKAGKKAFLFNRIGDLGFFVALMIFWTVFGTFELEAIKALQAEKILFNPEVWMIVAGLGLFLACAGKSAQFPLYVWLPDAMEGPTPVSALIHAATMVAAGVFLLAKVFVILTPEVLDVIAFTGALTAFLAAVPALMQHDIKKVLAYSTVSQLGYMVMGMGVQAYQASLFHLTTHAFFKACLFLSAGAVIHAMHHVQHDLFVRGHYLNFDVQDMRNMGGFRKKMPLIYYAYFAAALAMMGMPFFSGFLSKEAILTGTLNWAGAKGGVYYLVPLLGFITVFFTAVYMSRQLILVFRNEFRLGKKYPEADEAFRNLKPLNLRLQIPVALTGLLSLWLFYSWNPFSAASGWFFKTIEIPFPHELISPFMGDLHYLPMMLSLCLSMAGLFVAGSLYAAKQDNTLQEETSLLKLLKGKRTEVFRQNWFLDKIYYHLLVDMGFRLSRLVEKTDSLVIDKAVNLFGVINVVIAHLIAWTDRNIIDGTVNFSAWLAGRFGKMVRKLQGGKLQGYFALVLAGLLILLLIML